MIEIDVLPASSESQGGDSILIRIGNFNYEGRPNDQEVILIDGGYSENAKRIEDHLRCYYNTSVINYAIITHPDLDHISGFKKLLLEDNIEIENTFIHDPWCHAKGVFNKTVDGRRTVKSIGNKFETTLSNLSEVLDLCGSINTEPFSSLKIANNQLIILGPTKMYYEELLYMFPGMEGSVEYSNKKIYNEYESFYNPSLKHFLDEPNTSPKNSTSVISLLVGSQNKPVALFTGDAGVEAIEMAMEYADKLGYNLSGIPYFQIPHHGSIKNISKSIVDSIMPNIAFVSAPSEKVEHPSKLVLNYLTNKGVGVRHVMDVSTVCFPFDGAPSRPLWSPLQPFELYSKVNTLI